MIHMPEEVSLVPIWPVFVVPTLQVLSDAKSRQRREIFDAVAQHVDVSDGARAETLKSGGSRYEQRMGWVLSHLGKANWVDRPERGHYVINDAGRAALAKYPDGFDYALAREVFAPFWPEKRESVAPTNVPEQPSDEIYDPIEVIEDAVARIEASVGDDLLDRLRNTHPDFFEQAVVDLLLRMGYGEPHSGVGALVEAMMKASTDLSTKTHSASIRSTSRRSATRKVITSAENRYRRSSARSMASGHHVVSSSPLALSLREQLTTRRRCSRGSS